MGRTAATRLNVVIALFLGSSPFSIGVEVAVDDIDLWRVAGKLLKLYDENARFIAARRADALLDNGHVEGLHTWKRIAEMLGSLQRRDRDPNCTLH